MDQKNSGSFHHRVPTVYGPVNWNRFSDENLGEDIKKGGVGVVKQQKDI
jgi:hypothetical protein